MQKILSIPMIIIDSGLNDTYTLYDSYSKTIQNQYKNERRKRMVHKIKNPYWRHLFEKDKMNFWKTKEQNREEFYLEKRKKGAFK